MLVLTALRSADPRYVLINFTLDIISTSTVVIVRAGQTGLEVGVIVVIQ